MLISVLHYIEYFLRCQFVFAYNVNEMSKENEATTMQKFDSPEYRRSRGAYMTQCTVEYFVALLATGGFLAKLLTSIGISDALTGVISSISTLAYVFQLLSILLVRLKLNTKKLVVVLDSASIFFYMFLYFVPFVTENQTLRTVLAVGSVLFAYVSRFLIFNIYYKWANSYVDPTKRARFSAIKETISLFTGMIFTLILGYVIDGYEALGNLRGGFLFTAISILILNISNFICLMMIKNDTEDLHEGDTQPLKVVIRETLGNRSFRNVTFLNVLYNTGIHFTVGFIAVFKTSDLMMSLVQIEIIALAANFFRMLVTRPIGKYSDRHSFAKGYELGMWLAAAAFFVNIFTTPTTWVLVIVHTILYNCSIAGTSENSFNMIYNYVDSKYFAQAMALKNCISGIIGFGASIVGGWILAYVQANGNQIAGVPVYGQQVLSVLSFVVVMGAIVFSRKVVSKQSITVR